MTCPDIRIDLLSHPRLLKCIRETIRCYVTGLGYTEETANSVVLAVDEACSNAIRHSYGGCCDGRLELLLRSGGAGIEIVLSDQGKPAPPDCNEPARDRTPDPATVQPGGLGIHLMREVFDEVEFIPGEPSGNTVIMRLKQPPANDETASEQR